MFTALQSLNMTILKAMLAANPWQLERPATATLRRRHTSARTAIA